MLAAVSKPSMPGISTSRSTTANSWRSIALSASSPERARTSCWSSEPEYGLQGDEVLLHVVDDEDARAGRPMRRRLVSPS